VFRGGFEFSSHPLTNTAEAASASDTTSLVRSDGAQVTKMMRAPNADGTLEIAARVRGSDGDWTNCGGQGYAVMALLDGLAVDLAGANDTLYVHLNSESDRVDLHPRLASLPTGPGHRIELIAIGGIGRAFEYPLGQMTPWMDPNPFAFGKVEW
jgi:hypothetical protein